MRLLHRTTVLGNRIGTCDTLLGVEEKLNRQINTRSCYFLFRHSPPPLTTDGVCQFTLNGTVYLASAERVVLGSPVQAKR